MELALSYELKTEVLTVIVDMMIMLNMEFAFRVELFYFLYAFKLCKRREKHQKLNTSKNTLMNLTACQVTARLFSLLIKHLHKAKGK